MEIQDNGRRLLYTMGTIVCGPVKVGDVIELPGDRGSVTVLSGPHRAPLNGSTGSVQVSDSATLGGLGCRPDVLGMVWEPI